MQVSVVVPVFNAGAGVSALIESLRAQTLPADRWEAVFVDDGSTDDTADVVDDLIADDPNMRLLREAPSGWPGRPRNVGVDAAVGDYVFFADDDDTLGPEALERLTAFAAEHDSDVVIPRMVGRNRGAPTIPRTVVDAQDQPGLIMSTLTPQKLFRRAFLKEEGIRFVEGRYRLEDHLFVTTAYLRARRVSAYADYPCYYLAYQAGRPHISQQKPDWHAYFLSVRACLDRVDAEARDVATARAMRGRWLRAESLARLRGVGYEKLGSPELVTEVRQLVIDRYDEVELGALNAIDRLLVGLLLDGGDEDVAALAAWEAALRVTSRATAARIEPDGSVRVELRSELDAEAPFPDVRGSGPLHPSEDEVRQHVSRFTSVGVELLHARTKERRPLRVTHAEPGATVAVLPPVGEPLSSGRWTVMALAGEHKTRRRTPVEVPEGTAIDTTPRRVGEDLLRLQAAGKLVLRVNGTTAPAARPLHVRIAGRIRRLLPQGLRLRLG